MKLRKKNTQKTNIDNGKGWTNWREIKIIQTHGENTAKGN